MHTQRAQTSDLKKTNERIDTCIGAIELKQNKDEIPKIWENFKKYASFEHLKDLYAKVVPPIKKMQDEMAQHDEDM